VISRTAQVRCHALTPHRQPRSDASGRGGRSAPLGSSWRQRSAGPRASGRGGFGCTRPVVYSAALPLRPSPRRRQTQGGAGGVNGGVGHRVATRSAIDADCGARTICAEGEALGSVLVVAETGLLPTAERSPARTTSSAAGYHVWLALTVEIIKTRQALVRLEHPEDRWGIG
jgi:hypothetical protein